MVVVEPVVNAEKLHALLSEQSESESLDYKARCDLGDHREALEIAKDVAALQANGGYLVIGVDGRGQPTGSMTDTLAGSFDEAAFRPMLAKYLAPGFSVLTAVHDVDGCAVVLIYVAPHPDGFAVIEKDGQYDRLVNGKSQPRSVFRAGDVFVRHGTSSERWKQSDLPRLFRRRDERIREEARADLAKTIATVEQGRQGQDVASGPATAFAWQLDEITFDSTATELLRAGDLTPVRLLLTRALGDIESAANAGDEETVSVILDRLACLIGIAMTLREPMLVEQGVHALVASYGLGFDGSGTQRLDLPIAAPWLWIEIVGRAMALGGLAIRLSDWATVRLLASQSPHQQAHSYFASWFRHGLTTAYNSNSFPRVDGREVSGALIALARTHAYRLPALRPDRPHASPSDGELDARISDHDAILDSLCQFDALWGIIAMVSSRDVTSSQFYTSFAAYYPRRTEPVLLRLVDDLGFRGLLVGGANEDTLRSALRQLLSMARSEGWRLRGEPWDVFTPRIREFVDSQEGTPPSR